MIKTWTMLLHGRTRKRGTLCLPVFIVLIAPPGTVPSNDAFHYILAAESLAAGEGLAAEAAAFTLTVHAMLWMTSTVVGLLCLRPSWASANPAGARTTPHA